MQIVCKVFITAYTTCRQADKQLDALAFLKEREGKL